MRTTSKVIAIFAGGLGALYIGACKEAVSPPDASAAISVSVKVEGVFPSDRFQIEIDGRLAILPASAPNLVVRALSPGTHIVSLVGLPDPCKTDGANQTSVQTSSANLASVQFHITCVPLTGAIAVAVSVSGYDGQLWFQARVDSLASTPSVRGNATTLLDSLFSLGRHVVRLSGIPHYCEPTGEMSASVELRTSGTREDTAVANFHIDCNSPVLGGDTAASIVFERDGYIMTVRESGDSVIAVAAGEKPTWSPDGTQIAFQRLNCDADRICEHDLWLMDPMGKNQRPAFTTAVFDDYDIAFSPGSARIAFIRFLLGPDQTYLAVSDLNGGSVKILSIWDPIAKPSWSPDGTQIVFVCEGGRNTDLCLADTSKSCTSYFPSDCKLTISHLTSSSSDEEAPAWSPDGRKIAFTVNAHIAVIDVATRGITQLVAGHDPAWSPDGTQLVFAGDSGTPGLRVYSFSDASVRQLTNSASDRSPAWRQ